MANIVLIGMPGCGKSTVGVLLAKALQMDFVDTDIVLQQQQGKKLQEIIDQVFRVPSAIMAKWPPFRMRMPSSTTFSQRTSAMALLPYQVEL